MSSTNRSNARELHISDYYVTPIDAIKTFFSYANEFVPSFEQIMNTGRILDCCAGGNQPISDCLGYKEIYHPMSYPQSIKEFYNKQVDTYDIREDSLAKYKEDYLKVKLDYQPDVIITNPPFTIATDIIRKAINDVKENGMVIMLLRLNFFEGLNKKDFFEEVGLPNYSFVYRKRLSFQDKKDVAGYVQFNSDGKAKKGGSDSVAYQHCIWIKGKKADFTKLMVIDN